MMLVLFLCANAIFLSCSKDDDDTQTSLIGTKWTITYLGDKYVCEFTTKDDVILYEADANGNYENYLKEDKYSFDGTKVVFKNKKLYMTDWYGLSYYYEYSFKEATVVGSKMDVTTNSRKITTNITSTGIPTIEDKGTKNFILLKIN